MAATNTTEKPGFETVWETLQEVAERQKETERIQKHIERLEKMRAYVNLRGDKRNFLGAVAGIVVTEEVRKYALDQGLYLIEPAGDTFNITPPNGIPREW